MSISDELARRSTAARRERYASWLMGWSDGAAARAKRRAFMEHRREDLRRAYETGYDAGPGAHGAASEQASTYSGHVPTVLR